MANQRYTFTNVTTGVADVTESSFRAKAIDGDMAVDTSSRAYLCIGSEFTQIALPTTTNSPFLDFKEVPILDNNGVATGLNICHGRIGNVYTYWISGTVNSGTNPILTTGTVLATVTDFPELANYQGDPYLGTGYTLNATGNVGQQYMSSVGNTGITLATQVSLNDGYSMSLHEVLLLGD